MAGYAAVAHPCRAETLAGILLEGVEVFEEVFAGVEVFLHAGNVLDGWCCSRIAGLLGGAELSAGIPLFSREHVVGLSEGTLLGSE